MSDISQIKVGSTTYDIKDTTARTVATVNAVGRVKPDGTSIVIDNNGMISSVGSGGSNIYITTTDEDLFGETVTVTDGVFSDTATFDSTGHATISSFMGTGWVTISATVNNKTAYAYLDCSFYGSYRVTLEFFEATVNITTSDVSLYGDSVFVTSEVAPPATLTFSNLGATSYTVYVPGVYTFYVI